MKKKNILLKILLCCLSLLCVFCLFACEKVDLKYKIEFVVDGETVATAGTDSETIKMPKNPEKEDYAFDGWFWDEGEWKKPFTLNSIADQPIEEENVFQVYAKWVSTTEYTVCFSAGTGDGEMPDVVMKKGAPTALPKNVFTPENGYAFEGWNTQADGSGKGYADEEKVVDLCEAGESVTLYAQWRKATCTLTFDANGGTGAMQEREVFTYDHEVRVPCTFTPPKGKRFDSWNSKADGTGTRYGYGEGVYCPVAEGTELLLYAQWENKPKEYYTLSFNANGGSGIMTARKVERDEEFAIGEPTFTPPNSDYRFSSWNTKADGSGQRIAADDLVENLGEKDSEVTLYAQWTNSVYTITFVNSNSEDSFYKTRKVAVGERITLGGAGDFEAPEYCQFECWRLASDEPAYALTQWRRIDASEEVVDLAAAGETAYVYADWKIATGVQLYSVSTFAQLKTALENEVAQNTVVVLEQDIVCGELEYLNPCPEFAGVFIGNGHTIKNLRIVGDKSGEVQSGGLFGNIAATGKVIGLGLENVISTGSYATSFAYKNEGEIRSCFVVNGKVNFVGNPLDTDVMACGLVCENAASGELKDCYYSGEIIGQLQSGNGSAAVAGICFKNQGSMQNVYFYGKIDVAGSVSSANLFCIELQGSTASLAYCQSGDCVVNGTVYDNRLECAYAEKWTAETLYENRYNMGSGGIMYDEMNLATGSLGYVASSHNNWYHS